MRNIFVFIVTLALCFGIKAAEIYVEAPPNKQVIYTNQFISTNWSLSPTNTDPTNILTTSVTVTNISYATLNRTYHFIYIGKGTNRMSLTAYRSLDNANWFTWNSTNFTDTQATNASTTNIVEWSSSGKWYSHRFDFSNIETNWSSGSAILNEIAE